VSLNRTSVPVKRHLNRSNSLKVHEYDKTTGRQTDHWQWPLLGIYRNITAVLRVVLQLGLCKPLTNTNFTTCRKFILKLYCTGMNAVEFKSTVLVRVTQKSTLWKFRNSGNSIHITCRYSLHNYCNQKVKRYGHEINTPHKLRRCRNLELNVLPSLQWLQVIKHTDLDTVWWTVLGSWAPRGQWC